MEKFKAYSCNWTNGFVTSLFLAVAPKLLALRFDGIEDGRRNTATFYSFSITLAEGVETYRRIIWEILSLLCLESKNQPLIYNLLKNYGRSIDESSRAVVNADAPHIVSIMELAYPTSYLSNCLLAERLTDIFSTDETTFHLLDEYLNAPKLTLYRLMKGPRHSLEIHYHEREIAKNTPESVVKKYESDLELLEDIYIESISYSQHDDHDGKFLKEIYQTSPTILDKFISKILCSTNRPHFDEYREKSLACRYSP